MRPALPLAAILLAAAPAAADILGEGDYRARYEALVSKPGIVAQGNPVIVDGDTLKIAGVRIRLDDIDAPEKRERCGGNPCGAQASAALGRLLGDWVVCDIVAGDVRYPRLIGRCNGAAGDAAAALVLLGYARAEGPAYAAQEAEAKAALAGFWHPSRHLPEGWER